MTLTREMIARFDKEGPRYTSYPTAPVWDSDFSSDSYREALASAGSDSELLSLYVHIPFCEKRCLYCACNVVVRQAKPEVGDCYLDYLEKELRLIQAAAGTRLSLRQIHLGGGTPTFLNQTQLRRLNRLIHLFFDGSQIEEKSVEMDPRCSSVDDLRFLRLLGFNRLSFGVQDFDETVQNAVKRVQSKAMVSILIEAARDLGFQSVNCDLIYGLPEQSVASFESTIEHVIQLRPDRIALYSFAYVPGTQRHQVALDVLKMPAADVKLSMFIMARERLQAVDYEAIAMDHFALKDDDLAVAYRDGSLKRNFMGYSTLATEQYLGIGLSAIGFVAGHFIQNIKDLKVYYEVLDNGNLPVGRGYRLSERDLSTQWVIASLMCRFRLDKVAFKERFGKAFDVVYGDRTLFLAQCVEDGLLEFSSNCLIVTELGRLFVRNICMGFDDYLQVDSSRSFSRTI